MTESTTTTTTITTNLRFLNDGTESPVPTETFPPFHDGSFDTTDNDDKNEGLFQFGIVALAALLVVLGFVGWRFFTYWRIRQERYELQEQNHRADAVLGDMQMVPNDDDYDKDDPELL